MKTEIKKGRDLEYKTFSVRLSDENIKKLKSLKTSSWNLLFNRLLK